ncbi:hypothetical protein [Mycobacterium sp. NPDC006124]|uniref:hypothetical protein n=1 Tax=Mycobacterium sp. NPDC006124 TaxID=3156729 RepID=UPI0033B0EEFF
MSQLTASRVTPRGRIALQLGLILLVSIAGCRSTPAAPPPVSAPPQAQRAYQWPEKLADFRFRWWADPGFDLATGWAVPLRAYLESRRVVEYTDDVATAYLGFERATPPPVEPGSPELLKLPYAQREIRMPRGPSRFDDPGQRLAGNEDFDVLRTEPLADGFRAFVCDATFETYKWSASESRYVPVESYPGFQPTDYENMKVWRIEFSNRDPRVTSGAPASPDAPQTGPLPAPRNDVFGPWFVTGALGVGGWSDSDHPNLVDGSPEQRQRFQEAQDAEAAMRQQCLDRYPLDAAGRASRAQTAASTPPTMDPPVPGWPTEGT